MAAIPIHQTEDISDDMLVSQTLLSISNDIAATRTKDDLVNVLLDRLRVLVPFDDLLITVYNKERHAHYIWAHRYYERRKSHPAFDDYIIDEYPVDDGVLNIIQQQYGPVVFDIGEMVKSGKAPGYMQYYYDNGLSEFVGVMMRSVTKDVGGFFLTSTRKGNFKKEHLELIKGISSQLCIASSSILANEAILKHEEDKSILLAISDAVATVRDRKTLIAMVRQELEHLLPPHDLTLSFYDARRSFHYIAPFGHESEMQADGNLREVVPADSVFGAEVNNRIVHSKTAVHFDVEQLISEGCTAEYILSYRNTGIRHFTAFSMRNGAYFFGCLYLAFRNDAGFDTVNTELIQGIGHQLSFALVNIQANEEILERETEKSMLLTISNDMAAIRNKNDLLLTLQTRLKKLFYFSHMLTTIVDRETQTHSQFIIDPSSRSKKFPDYDRIVNTAYSLNDPLIKTVIHSKTPVIFDLDELAKQQTMPEWIMMNYASGIRELVMAPLFSGQDIVGFFILLSDRKKLIQNRELRLIQGICWQLSVAVANILANENLLDRDNEKATLLALSKEIAVVRNKQELHQLINEKLKKLLPISHIITFSISEDGKWYSAYSLDPASVSTGHQQYATITSSQYLVDDGILNLVLASDKPLVYDLDEVVKRPNVPAYLQMNHDVGVKEAVLSSLKDGIRKTGILIILMNHKSDLSLNYLNLIQGISDQLSAAVANIRANERIEQQLEEINNYKKQLEDEKLYLQEEIQINYNFSEMIGNSQPMKTVFQLVSKVADADSSVLLLGETGTGKELIARAIHNASSRKDKVMIKVNCAALPATLIESELFGHERGSFTGATERRIGKFELANHSTLFLDEIGELPLDLQVKLLRVLQEKEIERVGGRTTIKTDVRIIAATNRDLEKDILTGAFRSDLYFRLNVFPINIPPLRERKEDIPLLAAHFLVKHAKKGIRGNMNFSGRVMKELLAYDWPGNVRELEHLIERSVLLSDGRTVEKIHLPSRENGEMSLTTGRVKTIDEVERDYVLSILKKCHGKISGIGGAATLLKIPPTTLSSKMIKLGITRDMIGAQ